jgi:hypothetical protein
VKISDLGLGCLYTGGGGNTAMAPNPNAGGFDQAFDVSACLGSTLTLAGSPGTGAIAANGNHWGGPAVGIDCTLGPLATKHCTRTGTACASDADCGGAGLCNPDPRCIAGVPTPLSFGGFPRCALDVVGADASGALDMVSGSASVALPLTRYLYVANTVEKFCFDGAPGTNGLGACTTDAQCGGAAGTCRARPPCPVCQGTPSGNRCISGRSHGQPCTPTGSQATSPDCLPKGIDFMAPAALDVGTLGTGTSVLTAVQNPARSSQFFFCPVAGAGSCIPDPNPAAGSTCQRTQGCFGKTTCKRIAVTGSPAGNLSDGAARPVTLAAAFCIPSTGNSLADGGAGFDLPGPSAVTIRGSFQLTP